MLENTPWPCEETENAYALGSMAAEALVAVKGQEGMNNFYKASARTGDWKASFQEAFGLSVDNFYEKLTPYLASQFTESNFKYETATPTPSPALGSPGPSTSPVAQSQTPGTTPKPIASVSATIKPKIITITCTKKQSVKKISGISPKCPSGYKKK
jgi:hypothetical protein